MKNCYIEVAASNLKPLSASEIVEIYKWLVHIAFGFIVHTSISCKCVLAIGLVLLLILNGFYTYEIFRSNHINLTMKRRAGLSRTTNFDNFAFQQDFH